MGWGVHGTFARLDSARNPKDQPPGHRYRACESNRGRAARGFVAVCRVVDDWVGFEVGHRAAIHDLRQVRPVVLDMDFLPVAPQPWIKPRHLPMPLVNAKLRPQHMLLVEYGLAVPVLAPVLAGIVDSSAQSAFLISRALVSLPEFAR